MSKSIRIGRANVGEGEPVYIIGEIGINHNGDVEIAKKLIDVAAVAGFNAVKFQKRTPEVCVPASQRDIPRETPWGVMSYLEYRKRLEFGTEEYSIIDRYCREKKMAWFASCWDEPSVDLIERFDPVCHKVASACLTDEALVRRVNATGRPVILSTGMSTMDEIRRAASWVDPGRMLLAHSTSSYPCKPEELNLSMIQTLGKEFDCPIGYSGHEIGLQTTLAAVVMGACFIERHITLDRAMWGSDQAASVETGGMFRLVRDIRVVESARGDGVKRIYPSEMPSRERLRKSG